MTFEDMISCNVRASTGPDDKPATSAVAAIKPNFITVVGIILCSWMARLMYRCERDKLRLGSSRHRAPANILVVSANSHAALTRCRLHFDIIIILEIN